MLKFIRAPLIYLHISREERGWRSSPGKKLYYSDGVLGLFGPRQSSSQSVVAGDADAKNGFMQMRSRSKVSGPFMREFELRGHVLTELLFVLHLMLSFGDDIFCGQVILFLERRTLNLFIVGAKKSR